jgi:hypothetical protein
LRRLSLAARERGRALPAEPAQAKVLLADQARRIAVNIARLRELLRRAPFEGPELAPLYERLKQHLLASSRLAVDETPVPVLDRRQLATGIRVTVDSLVR